MELKNDSSASIEKQVERKKGNPCGCIAAGILGGAFLVFLVVVLMGNFLIASDPLEQVDAIVVLSGAENDRIPEAARLFQGGYADAVILTDTGWSVFPNLEKETIAIDPNVIKTTELTEMGVPISNIILPETIVNSTAGEAEAVLEVMQRQGMESAMIVTDPYHTRRAKIIFDDIFEGSGIRLFSHPVEGHWYQSFRWWLHPQGWKFAILEYLKIAFKP